MPQLLQQPGRKYLNHMGWCRTRHPDYTIPIWFFQTIHRKDGIFFMPKKKKSATYKLNYYDETGKRRCKTFSAPTRKMAKDLAEEWTNTHLDNGKPILYLSEALGRYIETKRGVLSPSTVRCYEGMQKKHFDSIGSISIQRLTKTDVQAWISGLSFSGLSPKTVRNYYGLLTAVLLQNDIQPPKVQLPQQKQYENYCPSDNDIATLIEQIQRNGDGELLRAVLLAAFGPCRRSEVCALTSDDIQGNVVFINKALVKDVNGAWVVKLPKTKDSTRRIVYPDFVIKELSGISGKLFPHTPDYIGDKFRKTLKQTGLPPFRFHDLRHYGASIMMYMGISQKTIEIRGGWSSNSPVLRRTYQNRIDAEMQKENEKINEHFKIFAV